MLYLTVCSVDTVVLVITDGCVRQLLFLKTDTGSSGGYKWYGQT